jgi:hypothetical protein
LFRKKCRSHRGATEGWSGTANGVAQDDRNANDLGISTPAYQLREVAQRSTSATTETSKIFRSKEVCQNMLHLP